MAAAVYWNTTQKCGLFSVYIPNRCVFREDLNEETDVECLTICGRLFQTAAVWYEKRSWSVRFARKPQYMKLKCKNINRLSVDRLQTDCKVNNYTFTERDRAKKKREGDRPTQAGRQAETDQRQSQKHKRQLVCRVDTHYGLRTFILSNGGRTGPTATKYRG